MKKASKFLSMLLLVTMCLGLIGGMSAFAANATVTVAQVGEQPEETSGTVAFNVTSDRPVSLTSVYFNGDQQVKASAISGALNNATSGTIVVSDSTWTGVTSMTFNFSDGTYSWSVDVEYGNGKSNSHTLAVDDPKVTATVTAVEGDNTKYTVDPIDTLMYVLGDSATASYTVSGSDVIVPLAESYNTLTFCFNSDKVLNPAVTVTVEKAPPAATLTVSPTGASFDKTTDVLTFSTTTAVTKVTVDGVELSDTSYTKNSIQVSLPVAALILAGGPNKASYTVTFSDGTEDVNVTVVNNTLYGGDNQTNEGNGQEPTIYYLQGSGNTVAFDTTANGSDVTLYDTVSHNTIIPALGADMTINYNAVSGTAIVFTNSFLDNKLTAGRTYQIVLAYGTGINQYKTVGYIKVGTSNTTPLLDNSLWFTNGNTSDKTVFKYISGSIAPEMCSAIFLIDGGYLQYSTNGGASWSYVGIDDYFIRLDANGGRTQYAFLKDVFLNKLSPDTIYYFRAFLPANKSTTGLEVHSNSIQLMTGAALKYVDTDKHVINSTKNLKFTSSQKIAKVYVGNVELTDPNYFSVSNDKKTVTLSPEFLNGRTAGQTYTITVLTDQGERLSTTFKILTTAQAASSPKTGDSANMGLWIAAMILSGGAAVIALPRMKKIGSK